jgi:hypothetical protein
MTDQRQMGPLHPVDLAKAIQLLPPMVVEALKMLPIVLAGGYIRSRVTGEDPNDIDLFVPSLETASTLVATLGKENCGKIIETGNAWSFRGPAAGPMIQVIHRWTYEKPEDLLQSFDFTIAKAAIWWHLTEGWRSLAAPTFYADLAAKRLVYTSPQRNEDAGGSLLRMLKFIKRGYHIPPASTAAVMARLYMGMSTGARDSGREDAVAADLCRLLVEVDPQMTAELRSELEVDRREQRDRRDQGPPPAF